MVGDDLTVRLMVDRLKAATLRNNVIANNIANINTPGFKRSRVEFESQLADAMAAHADPDSVKPVVVQETDTSLRPDGNNVDIEQEMSLLAQNQLVFATLTRQLSDKYQRLHQVVTDGRG